MVSSRRVGIVLFCVFVVASSLRAATEDASAIFREKCSSCHGIDGSAKTPAGKKIGAADLRSKEIAEMTDKDLFETIGRGTRHRNYPHSFLYTGLTEGQVHGLVAYIRVLQKKK
jgi:mono/diheme cytochrome c family protein